MARKAVRFTHACTRTSTAVDQFSLRVFLFIVYVIRTQVRRLLVIDFEGSKHSHLSRADAVDLKARRPSPSNVNTDVGLCFNHSTVAVTRGQIYSFFQL